MMDNLICDFLKLETIFYTTAVQSSFNSNAHFCNVDKSWMESCFFSWFSEYMLPKEKFILEKFWEKLSVRHLFIDIFELSKKSFDELGHDYKFCQLL